jgi:multiple sugar transport system ATP-binding protein
MARIRYESATRRFDEGAKPAVDRLDLEVRDGELLVLVGPSGSGKSTALRMLAGLEPVDEGRLLIDGVDVTGLRPAARDVAMVFQNYALYPHMTAAENMGFSLELAGVGRAERERRVREVARMLDLEAYLDRTPKRLSGGQRQRVAMGRAIVRQPKVFLMDEPLSNLDAKLRVRTRAEVSALQARLGVTTLYVTHDQVEAMTMGHRIAVLDAGRLQQCDTPRALYERPANAFVAGFIGSPAMNLLVARLEPRGVRLGGAVVPLPDDTLAAARAGGLRELTLGIRPESFALAPGADGIPMTIRAVEELGADAFVHGDVELDGSVAAVVVRAEARAPPRRGERVSLVVRGGELHAFDPRTGTRLGRSTP